MRVIALFRVSTEAQSTEGSSLDSQQRIYRELAARSGWTTLAEFRGVESGALAVQDRAVLQQVLGAVRDLRADAIYVHEQSRLTRGDELEVALLLRELRERQMRVIVQGSIRDLGSIDDRFMLGIQSLVDRAEYERIRERTTRGRREKARQGKRAGSISPFGYQNPPKGHPQRGTLQIVPAEAAVVRRMFAWSASGVSAKEIARRLNTDGSRTRRGSRWCKSSVVSILKNPAYLGVAFSGAWKQVPGKRYHAPDMSRAIVVPDAHEAIVDRETWEASQRALRERATGGGRIGMLTGMLRIEGRLPTIDGSKGRNSYALKGGPWVSVALVNAAVWAEFVRLVEGELLDEIIRASQAPEQLGAIQAEADAAAAEIEKLRRRQAALIDLRADGEISPAEFAERAEEYRSAIAAAEERHRVALVRVASLDGTDLRRAAAAVRAVVGSPHRLTDAQKRRLIASVVEWVDVELERVPLERDEKGRTVKGSSPWKVQQIQLSPLRQVSDT